MYRNIKVIHEKIKLTLARFAPHNLGPCALNLFVCTLEFYDGRPGPQSSPNKLDVVFSRACPSDDHGGFQLLDLIITELKSHMTC